MYFRHLYVSAPPSDAEASTVKNTACPAVATLSCVDLSVAVSVTGVGDGVAVGVGVTVGVAVAVGVGVGVGLTHVTVTTFVLTDRSESAWVTTA